MLHTGYTRLLADPAHPDADADADGPDGDRFSALVDWLLEGTGPPLGSLVAGAWRAALRQASYPDATAAQARPGLARLLSGA